ncbi:glycosyltransferase family 2 protein [Roseivivax marinus]|uniref:glycosyltransferase family 2 protein n=1 Tax=Roseivivax marinus TaxID=1379903 RepID=UPI00273F5352|nr:glycosyltransferase family 2 protein [Roseivivax marinus]
MTQSCRPVLSIGLPVCNGAQYLREAIDSILSQTWDDFELIISDNASEDETADICAAYAEQDPRVRLIRQPRNLGAAPNYNLLVDEARGRYFKWAAHDDNLRPRFLEACIDALEANPQAVLAYPRTDVIDGAGRVIGPFDDGLDLRGETAEDRLVAYLRRNFMRQRGLCNPIFGVIRTDELRRTKLIQDFLASDLILLAHLSLLGQFAEIPETLFDRRVHAGISTAAHTSHAARRRWFNAGAKRGHWLSDNDLALRMVHIRDLFTAISELVPERDARNRCRWALARLLATDPKWLYIDVKYSLGLRPSWQQSSQSIARAGAH